MQLIDKKQIDKVKKESIIFLIFAIILILLTIIFLLSINYSLMLFISLTTISFLLTITFFICFLIKRNNKILLTKIIDGHFEHIVGSAILKSNKKIKVKTNYDIKTINLLKPLSYQFKKDVKYQFNVGYKDYLYAFREDDFC